MKGKLLTWLILLLVAIAIVALAGAAWYFSANAPGGYTFPFHQPDPIKHWFTDPNCHFHFDSSAKRYIKQLSDAKSFHHKSPNTDTFKHNLPNLDPFGDNFSASRQSPQPKLPRLLPFQLRHPISP